MRLVSDPLDTDTSEETLKSTFPNDWTPELLSVIVWGPALDWAFELTKTAAVKAAPCRVDSTRASPVVELADHSILDLEPD